ncbi:MAG: S4 domain-containing protein, partial [Oscillospiraceae bacterium]|nr:S4 domain-containing protein [Oscillospiraceae bacterium]
MEERIQKLLSEQGFCSRREAERLIGAGRVSVNGRTALLGDKADARRDEICVDGRRLFMQKNVSKYYYMLHKPRGYVCTLKDRH